MKIFDKVAAKRPPRNKFDLSHEKKLSCNMGDLIPIMVQEILPGDKFRVNSEIFMRIAPLVTPIMHRVNCKVEYFFVPNRLIDANWEMFITRGRNGEQSPAPPTFLLNTVTEDETYFGLLNKGTLWDYMGGVTLDLGELGSVTDNRKISLLPFRAYQKVYDDYYRDPTLQSPLFQADTAGATPEIPITGGNITGDPLFETLTLRRRCWEKDYFTSAQPTAQRGADVQIPIEGLDVNYKTITDVKTSAGGVPSNADLTVLAGTMDTSLGQAVRVENIDSIDGFGLTVNELRTTLRLQEWFEKNARAGYRYIEQIYSHFGVKSKDARLQRAEYLGGGRVPVKISEVLSTFGSEEVGSTPNVGEMSGHGVAFGQSNRFEKSFEEHGFVIGVMTIIPRTNYQQGLPRYMTHRDSWDQYYWPEFAHLGEQEVVQSEIYFDPDDTPANNDTVFGYQSRYCEYKYGISTVHGDMRESLDIWHMGRKFSARPALNAAFVQADPTHRIFNVTDETVDKVYCHILNKVDAIRPMPYFGVPTI